MKSQEKNIEKGGKTHIWRNNDWKMSKFTENYIPTDSIQGVQRPIDLIQGVPWSLAE